MKTLALILAATFALTAPRAAAQSLDSLQKGFMEKYDALNQERDEKLDKLTTSYAAALKRLLQDLQKTGNLDAVLPARDELTAIESGKDELPTLAPTSPPPLRSHRAKFLEARTTIHADHARALVALADRMNSLLATQEADLTKAGKLDDALAAKRMRETLANDPGIRQARELTPSANSFATGQPALQLRRYGDNLEVLVYHDRSGKISMDSPVKNTRERTGEGKELGDTEAQTLGEFVGAKGYTVDPYVSCAHEFGGTDMGGWVLNQMAATPRFEVEEGKGVKLTLKPGATAPYGSSGSVLPPLASKGTFRITTRYYIPRSNRAVSGFMYVHGEGAAIGSTTLDKAGTWVDQAVVGESTNQAERILLYLCLSQAKTLAEAMDDFIVLGSVKVEHVRFSAYVQRRLDRDAGNGDEKEWREAGDQPRLICNGEFAPVP